MTGRQTGASAGRRIRLDRESRRDQILAAATGLIARRGFWGLTVREVALECAITEAGVLHHVGSKDRLLTAVLEYRDRLDRHALASRLGVDVAALEADPAPFGLRELCVATVERNAAQPEIVQLYAVLQGEALAAEHPAHDYFVRRERIAMSLFERAAAASGVDAALRETTARETMAAMDGLQLRWLTDRDAVDFVREWERFADRLFA
ncbi:helix-turn-helix domain-containing protein [Microbacterium sp. NPDC089320]|uniref:TetR/AcrR family transcriptional regulator n=1 Tax=Microbacterium sp. NPDC089320 TaxID=3155182 RepID=UPI003428C50F